MSDFRGARGSNTGDDYHELWAARHALRLLDESDPLEAMTVEGIAPVDEASAPEATWDGVDCGLYEGGRDARGASRIVLEQFKYSAASPNRAWTAARLAEGATREKSVLHRLARAWSGIKQLAPSGPAEVALVTNQPIAQATQAALATLAAEGVAIPRARPRASAPYTARLAYASGLPATALPEFARALRLRGGTGSRFAIEEDLLAALAAWTDLELQKTVADLRQFIRDRMRPEFKGEVITRETLLLQGLGVASSGALLPCPPALTRITDPVPRASVAEAARRCVAGEQYLCLHGPGGIGKTTALQQIDAALPAQSIMVTYDCYGGGTFLDAGTLRHRPEDAFLQLSNELATRLRMPILLGRHQMADPARHFSNRLRHAAAAYAAQHPDALIVIAVDAADNAVTAAATRRPAEACFVNDFAALADLPVNVRFLITARSGRLPELALPRRFASIPITSFTRAETEAHVRRVWDATSDWLDDFHQLSAGLPRVQAYAMTLGDAPPERAIDRLLPVGRTLDQVFREQFERALAKGGGAAAGLASFCAGLIALPRPVPLDDLAGVLGIEQAALIDICSDMMPAIRLREGEVGFADEDFEHFVREEGLSALPAVTAAAAEWLFARRDRDSYAAQHVAGALAAAARGADLLELVEAESSPAIIADPVQRRETELARLRIAIAVCRESRDPARAMRFVLIGGEALKTERALRAMLSDNPDLAVRFAADTAGRLILTDPQQIGSHGAFLFHKQVLDAARGDRISLREGRRLLAAWMRARKQQEGETRRSGWRLEVSDVAAAIEAALRAEGAEAALDALRRWTPRRVHLEVSRALAPRLLAQGDGALLQAVLDTKRLAPWQALFLMVPMSMAGFPVDLGVLAEGLAGLRARKLGFARFMARSETDSLRSWMIDTAMSACELLAADAAAAALVDEVLGDILEPSNRQIARHSGGGTTRLDLLFRAHALRAAREGQVPDPKTIFEPRPEPRERDRRASAAQHTDEADRKLRDLTTALYPTYAARATALAGPVAPETLEELLDAAAKRRSEDDWRFSREVGGRSLAMTAARSVFLLLTRGFEPELLAGAARRLHRYWGTADLNPDSAFAEAMALSPALHGAIVAEIDTAVSAIRVRRMGAEEKSAALLVYARLLMPMSPADANAVFHDAVEAASQLDREILGQLRLLAKLFERGLTVIDDRRAAARDLSETLADAAVRLDGEAELPWDEVMGVLAAFDLPLALANCAKWADADLAPWRETLAPVLKTGLERDEFSPAEAMALDLFLHGDHRIISAALDRLHPGATKGAFLEEAAWDALVRHDHRANDALAARCAEAGADGRWARALAKRKAYLAGLPASEPRTRSHEGRRSPSADRLEPVRPAWTREVLLDPEAFGGELKAYLAGARAAEQYVSCGEVVGWAAEGVALADRLAFLDMLPGLKAGIAGEIVESLLNLVSEWSSPAVRQWAATALPGVITARLPEFIRYIAHGETSLPRALEQAATDAAQTIELLLKGIELHGDALGGDQVFGLAGLIAGHLDASSAAELARWYARRLADRIEPGDRDQTWVAADMPDTATAAVGRFVYACMGDFDVRVRWRAAHAVRRLARLDAGPALAALIGEYGRREEKAFRSPALEFYWIAARLWFTIACDRIAGEAPQIGGLAGPTLLAAALDPDFPHLLVQSFARDACLKLVDAQTFEVPPPSLSALKAVARSPLPLQAVPEWRPRGRRGDVSDEGRRFHFDSLDTVPYWYDPMLDAFAEVSQDQLLATAEGWIIDRWGYQGDIRAFEAERRRHRFSDRDWSLASNRHGSNPTLERLNTHLEWHALWCAAGELLRTEPLAALPDKDWDTLPRRIAGEMLTEPPLWSTDRRAPLPLRADFWREPEAPLAEWVNEVREDRMRAELLPQDRPGYIVVGGSWDVRTYDRIEHVSFTSALVAPAIAPALLRATQSMDSAWDYGIPREGDHGLDEDGWGDYAMTPWLRTPSSDAGIDDHDPFRGNAGQVSWQPGHKVLDACALTRNPGGTVWSARDRPPMFIFEAWGEHDRDEERYRTALAVAGNRLLVETVQLQEFLEGETLDLVVEVEVTREGRDNRRSYDPEDQTPEAAYDRIYRLDPAGGLYAAEGRIGTWAGYSPPA